MELVVGASNATMRSLLGKLGGLLAQEYALVRGVRRDVQYINDELTSMQAFLRDLSTALDDHDNRMKDWMKQIRDMGYDIEDCIDDFAHRIPRDPSSDVKCLFIRTRFYELRMWWPRRDIASKIADLKVRAQQIGERRRRYGVHNPRNRKNGSGVSAGTYEVAEHQLTERQLIGTKEPVGMTADMEKLEDWLAKSDKSCYEERAVLSIVGFGGVGKTTIAMALYQKVRDKFDYRASVTVSQNYDEDAVLMMILKQVKPKESDHENQHKTGSSDVKQIKFEISHDKLVNELRDHLAEKRYLLLIDDIWSAKTWESIRKCLPHENKKGSRVIVTTRFQAVGATCSQGVIDFVHPVEFLNEDESKRLFKRSVSESKSIKYSEKELDQVTEEICKICRGLPLAIVTMAGLVASNPNTLSKKWEAVCKSLFPESVPSLTLDGVTRILEYCYNDLPAELRTCSLYLSIFPKGSKISRKRLIRRLIAEGFVSEKHGLSDEEVAETYFNQLIKRKIIRPVEHSSNGKVKSFQVHDMVLEYIVSKSSEENFITVVGGHWLIPMSTNKVRRLSVQSSGSEHGSSTKHMNLSQVRSLTMFRSLDQLHFHSFNNGILQVLDLEGCKGLKEKHLKDMCRMLVLKYLSLRGTDISKIPSKIEKLEYLETLDLRETDVGELPKSAGQLKRIINIFGGNKNPRRGLKLPQEINKETMKALRILSGIEIDEQSTGVEGLHQLTGLRKLAIYKLIILKDSKIFKELRSAIEYLGSCGLQTLALNDEGSDFINSLDTMSAPPRYLSALELSGNLDSLPKWINKLDNLHKLTLSVTVLRMDTFELLWKLPSLFSLTFSLSAAKQDEAIEDILEKNKSESGGEIFVPSGGFKSLKLLRFFAPLVPKLSFPKDAMPALERIEMRFEAFEGLFGVDTLKSLQEVHLRVNSAADEITNFIVEDLKTIKKPKIIVDHVITS
ncbi:disease resistance protein Pik-2 [Aegilops tauschii subsp. strangulata]|uniref:Disease resistance protein RPM1 n=6 Tax=Triticinae TaxID=1648030 RepID=A0A453DPQ2_AEGTS|nr:disease resistance protein Pik-2 [Aegilops tauschii subsp. strangulata]XP_040259101.1 disease resistance protein Pik-2 [Aegilops tauschii subsp. strangulata]XP_045090456.1 disease resistance protein Pik-2 [Aegilops tauschii subsp. strangulata]APG42615.1 nucleotide binding-leucine rich repeat protein [Triticum aestivum]